MFYKTNVETDMDSAFLLYHQNCEDKKYDKMQVLHLYKGIRLTAAIKRNYIVDLLRNIP